MHIFEIDISYLNNQYSSTETFFAGVTQAFYFAIPVSVPLLICLRRLLVEGIPAGIASYLGNSVGQTFFLFMILGGSREYIQFWYDWEPVLYIIGLLVTLKILFSFYLESRLRRPTGSELDPKTLFRFLILTFILVICNPVNAINLTGFVTNNTILSVDSFLLLYLLGFFISLTGLSILFGFGFYLIRNWLLVILIKPYSMFMKTVNRGLVIFSLALIFNATGKLAWELFTYYPAEKVLTSEIFLGTKPAEPLRKFNPLDFGIRSRNRPISVYSRFPLKVLIQRRVWMNKPPLTASQENQVYFRYNIHCVNQFSDWMSKLSFTTRTPFINKNTPEQIRRLQQVKADYVELNKIVQNSQPRVPSPTEPANRWKGKPPANYTQEQRDLRPENSLNSPYLHPDLMDSSSSLPTSKNYMEFDSFHNPFRFTAEGKYTNSSLIKKIDLLV
jgi:hypothetical protein